MSQQHDLSRWPFKAALAGHGLVEGEVHDFLAPAEHHPMWVEWSDTWTDYPRDSCIHEWFQAQVEQTPDAVAVVCQGERMTYGELNRRANQVAHHLRTLGVGPEVVVGICVERSLEMVVGLLGILKSGGAYLPLDPAYPKERLTLMLEDTCTPVLLTQERLTAILPGCAARILCLDRDWGSIAQESDANPSSLATAENLAYVIYTSGSTGQPKGVLVEHRSLVNYTAAASDEFDIGPGDRVLQFASISWDTSAEEIFPCLTRGATLVLRTDSMVSSIAAFLAKCQDWELTVLDLPTAYWHELAATLCVEALSFPPSVRLLIIGGERALPERLLEWHDHVGGAVRVVNTYGLTEATAVSTVYECSEATDADAPLREVPIGRPIRNVHTYVLDPSLQPVPVGDAGELYVGGEGLARGYLNRPDLTAERFIPNPFSDDPGERIYKTGDLARYLPDGNIEFLGRIDDQVKIRGFRIEVREVEAVLGQHPAVRQAVVVAREDEPGDKRLVAYVIPNEGPAPNVSDLRGFLKRTLPDYMVPTAFVFIESLPLTPNGKVDRRALPAPDALRPALGGIFVGPRDEVERWLAEIWEDVLGVHPIGVRDNFFELGGHSMLAVRLLVQIERVFGRHLSMVTLFQSPTIEQLANALREDLKESPVSRSALVAIQPFGSRPPFFCIPGNLGNVFTDLGDLARHLGSDQPLYGLQDGTQNPTKIKALAARYLEEVRAVQPQGPYLLGGICSGGVVAFEMAQQLEALGLPVGLLALIEPEEPSTTDLASYLDFAASLFRNVVRRLEHHSRNISHLGSIERKSYLRLKVKLVGNDWAVKRYAAKPYAGRISLFLASKSLEGDHIAQLDWCRLAVGGAQIYEIPGSHDTVTRTRGAAPEESHVHVLAGYLRTCIDGVLGNDQRT